jgi:hypothetical protein
VAKARKATAKHSTTGRSVPRASKFFEHRGVATLAAGQNVRPVKRVENLAANLRDSSEDLEAFLADVYRARNAGVASNGPRKEPE